MPCSFLEIGMKTSLASELAGRVAYPHFHETWSCVCGAGIQPVTSGPWGQVHGGPWSQVHGVKDLNSLSVRLKIASLKQPNPLRYSHFDPKWLSTWSFRRCLNDKLLFQPFQEIFTAYRPLVWPKQPNCSTNRTLR